ncbi:isochorismatase family protein [Spirosoma rhododendri]|uniref:Isochorismatase family protein n=1 Tax=Spirosoma rhododendri TaxID=2728024 RepID=A0A7L5DUG3_9BACT|nr:isochorismatase family protein [Spirosoma rhododendri]QJD81111.1 isochorismatase family protein [Spirosoma rhododendri]
MITALDSKTALVQIDMQRGIVSGDKAHPTQAIIDNIARLQTAFRQAGLPVVIVHVEPIGSPASVVRSERNQFPKDKAGQQQMLDQMQASHFFDIVDPLTPQPGDLTITKETWNAFFNTPLHDELQQRGITGIVLCGISTSVGVEGTARSANERGYNISFATDAMTDNALDAHNYSLKYIFPRIGELGTTDEIIAKLTERS